MKKFPIVTVGTTSIFLASCFFTSVEKPTSSSTPSSLQLVYVGDQLKNASPTPSISSTSNTNDISPTPRVSPSLSPSPIPTETPTPFMTYPPDVISKNLSFVDWPEYPGVQFFRGSGKGVMPYYSQAVVGGIEVSDKTGKLLVQMGQLWSPAYDSLGGQYALLIANSCTPSDDSLGDDKETWGLFSFTETSGVQSWNPEKRAKCEQIYSYSGTRKEYKVPVSYSPEDFISTGDPTDDFSSKGIIARLEYNTGGPAPSYDWQRKEFYLSLNASSDISSDEVLLSKLDAPILESTVFSAYLKSLNRMVRSAWERSTRQELSADEYFNRTVTLGKRALYVVLPDFVKKKLMIYAFILPSLERVVTYEVPFSTLNSFKNNEYFENIIMLRYHSTTDKLYLFIDKSGLYPLLKEVPPYKTKSTDSFIGIPELVRFSEDVVLQ